MKKLVLSLILAAVCMSVKAQQMSYQGINAKSFHIKTNTQNKFKASYEDATGTVQKTINADEQGAMIMLSYDITLLAGQAHLSIKSSDSDLVVWEKEITESSKISNFLISIQGSGEYMLSFKLNTATGKQFFKVELNPSKLHNAHG